MIAMPHDRTGSFDVERVRADFPLLARRCTTSR